MNWVCTAVVFFVVLNLKKCKIKLSTRINYMAIIHFPLLCVSFPPSGDSVNYICKTLLSENKSLNLPIKRLSSHFKIKYGHLGNC